MPNENTQPTPRAREREPEDERERQRKLDEQREALRQELDQPQRGSYRNRALFSDDDRRRP